MFISKIHNGANELYGEQKVHGISIAIDRVIHYKENTANQIIKQVKNMTPNTSLIATDVYCLNFPIIKSKFSVNLQRINKPQLYVADI